MRAVILLVLLAPTSFATVQATSQAATPDGRIHTRIEGINIPPVVDSPFTAKVVVTWDQPLVGGGVVSRKYYTLVARDSQGRVRRETRDFIPADSNVEPPLRSFAVTDPVSSTRITCVQDAMNCTVVDFHAPCCDRSGQRPSPLAQTKGPQPTKSRPADDELPAGRGNPRNYEHRRRDRRQQPRCYQQQGPLVFARLEHVSFRHPKGPAIGSDHTDGHGSFAYEPDPSWFGVPAGYKIVDSRNQSASKAGSVQ